MQYNESQYDGDSYNLTNYTSLLLESVSSSDDISKQVSITKTDSQGTADVISDGVSLTALLDTVTIIQRAITPFPYNNGMYNQYMYNARMDEDEILLMATKALLDSVTPSDFLAPFSAEKVVLETVSGADAVSFVSSMSLLDFMFLSEFITIQITNKALNDTIEVSDWLTIKQNPQSVEWFD